MQILAQLTITFEATSRAFTPYVYMTDTITFYCNDLVMTLTLWGMIVNL